MKDHELKIKEKEKCDDCEWKTRGYAIIPYVMGVTERLQTLQRVFKIINRKPRSYFA